MFRKIIVGMSGGVDSAISAFLLKEKGFKVMGVFMRNWDEFDETGHCSGEQDLLDAEYACKILDIELRQVNYVKDYWNSVFTQFLDDYQNGLTPNPDILCNKYIKFDLFYKYAIEELEYDAIATGHYARSSFGTYFEQYQPTEDARLLIPKDTLKDQTFFLSGVQRKSLNRTLFPLDSLLKSEVKQLARKCGLARLANKKESTGICFVGKRDFKEFIEEYIASKPGQFIDIDTGKCVGQHNGLHQWTVGQRCRLHSCLQPYYVVHKDVVSNVIHVAAGHEHSSLYNDIIHAVDVNWLCEQPFAQDEPLHCRFRFQHTKPLVDCVMYRDANTANGVVIELRQPLRAVTPGQYAVFYNEQQCLGSARIVMAKQSSTRRVLHN